jgi:hypothetical protein
MVQHLLHVEAKSPVRQNKTDRGTVFYQDLSISAVCDLEEIPSLNDDTELSLYFWVEVIEPHAMALLDWHSFTTSSRLSLRLGETQSVTLQFDVPAQATPGIYPYTIVVKAQQALEETVRVPLQLEIVSIPAAIRFKPIPGFTIHPPTTTTHPGQLQPGQSLSFKITVENRSLTADRFYLTCPVLNRDWFTFKYLDYGDKIREVVQPPNGLQLAPHEKGDILLTFHPPREMLAGDYCFPLQLLSMNHPDLGMVDEVYLQVLPDLRLETVLRPETQLIPGTVPVFTLKLLNRGNVFQQFKLKVQDSHQLFTFLTGVADDTIEVAPGAETTLVVKPEPRRWWNRPLGRQPKKLPVRFNLIPVGTDPSQVSPISLRARLIWLPYPVWMRVLLWLGIVSLFLFVLYRFNRQPSPGLEISEFSAILQPENNRDALQFNWRVRDPGTLDRIEIVRVEEGAEMGKQTYPFKLGIPAQLQTKPAQKSGCRATVSSSASARSFTLWQLPLPAIPGLASLQRPPAPATTIDCRGIAIATPKPGEYRFRLKLFSKDNALVPSTDRTTDVMTVKGNEPGS